MKKKEIYKNSITEELPECVRCEQPMHESWGGFSFCGRADCPNYGLLQTGIIGIKKLLIKKKKS